MPSLRINEQLHAIGELLTTDRTSGLTLAPEAARDEMRRRVGKNIRNEDLFAGCRNAFENGFQRVKLYFMCGLPGEQQADLDGIAEMSEHISRLGKEVTGRFATVVANVSNFVPRPHTPYQWHGMRRREYFRDVHEYLRNRFRYRTVQLKCHDIRHQPAGVRPRPRRPPLGGRSSRPCGAVAPASTPGPSISSPHSGGKPSPSRASTSRRWSTATIPSTPPCPGTTSASAKAAVTWSTSRREPERRKTSDKGEWSVVSERKGHRPLTTDHRPPTTDHQPPTTNH